MLVCVLLGPSLGAPLAAQQALTESTARQQQHAAGLRSAPEAVDPAASQSIPALVFGSDDTYRWEGAAIGFAIGAVTFTYAGLLWCADNCEVTAVASSILVGGILFGFPGMLIGGLFSKHPPVRTQEGAASGTP